MNKEGFRSGFITIIGRPNVGKSTLLNTLVGQKIAIISDKPQTTRSKILGIRTTENNQMVFTDTPGIHKPRTKLGEYMNKVVKESQQEADVVLTVIEAADRLCEADKDIINRVKDSGLPAILVINKIDKIQKDKLLPLIQSCSEQYEFDAIVPISAMKNNGIDVLIQELEKHLIEGPEFYPAEMVTDQPERQVAAEIIREKLLRQLDKEIPHGIGIEITAFVDKSDISEITANIYCEKDSHKGIIIGKRGDGLKRVGTLAREELEKIMERKVYLELWVKVKPDWRNSNYIMKELGYQ